VFKWFRAYHLLLSGIALLCKPGSALAQRVGICCLAF
jgi:hypothetical protein